MASVFSFEAIGTHWQIDLPETLSPGREAAVNARIQERIARFDLAYSRFRPDSLVTKMAREAGTYRLPDDADPMLSLYKRLYSLTDGAVTPLIGQTLVDAGYDAQYSLKPKETISKPPSWDEAIDWQAPNLIIKQPVLLDFGAAGKGYLIDLVGEELLAEGIDSFIIDAGGDILHRSATNEPLRVGLEDPDDTTKAIGVAVIENQSICGSAGNRRTWDKYHHTIDPRTLESPKETLAIWVVAKTALLADALTTCLAFTRPEILLESFSFSYLLLNADRSAQHSPDFPAKIFT